MLSKFFAAAMLLFIGAAVPAQAELPPAAVAGFLKACNGHDGWTDPAPPVKLFGNTYAVGTCGITALLVVSDEGLILLDGGPPEAAPLVLGNIRRLGFDPHDVKWILISHEHSDHVGALAEIQRVTGAKVAALSTARTALETGQPDRDDPQLGSIPGFTGFHVDRILHDGDQVSLGEVVLTAHSTPVHVPGSTSWTWRSCQGAACLAIAYADSISTISAKGYRFSDHPERLAQIRQGLDAVAALDCDILISPHPGASDLQERLASNALVNPRACIDYAQSGRDAFDKRLAEEAGNTH